MRSKTNEAKVKPLRVAFGDYFDQLKLVEADLLNEESLRAACEGADYIVHTASPFPLANPRDESEVIKPAVDGTLSILRAARDNKVKKLVITSSIAAIMMPADEHKKEVLTEEDWTDVN